MRTRRCRTRRRWREIGVVAGLATVSLLPPVSARASGVAATPAPKPPASGVHETTPLSGASDPNTGQVTVQEHTCKPKGPNTRAAMGKAVNACNPDTDWQTEVTVTWTQTGVVNGKPVGIAKQTRTQRPGPGEVTTAAAPAPETQTLKGAPPPSGVPSSRLTAAFPQLRCPTRITGMDRPAAGVAPTPGSNRSGGMSPTGPEAASATTPSISTS